MTERDKVVAFLTREAIAAHKLFLAHSDNLKAKEFYNGYRAACETLALQIEAGDHV